MSHVTVCEVGPRDGLQNMVRHFSVEERVGLIDQLSAAGARRIEAVSFVNDTRVPQMAGAEAVLAGVARRPGTEFAGLVLNARGVSRALACDLAEIRFVIVASETFSRHNQGASIAETVAAFETSARAVEAVERRAVAVIAAAFGCPFEGVVPVARVVDLAIAARNAGADEIILADTIGSAVPTEVTVLFEAVSARVGDVPLGGHFHNTRNMGYANVHAALRAGATVLDASIGGLGGCPFAPRATGNIATEDLGFMLRGMGLPTGLDLNALIGINAWLGERLGAAPPGLVARAGLFPEVADISASQ